MNNAWIIGAYGKKAGNYLIENLPFAKMPEERASI